MQSAFGGCVYALHHYREEVPLLGDPDCNETNELIPAELRDGFRPILGALLREDSARRSWVWELFGNDWLMEP